MIAVTVDGEAVLLVNVDGTVRAYSNRCPHQASALDEGHLDGETLTCAKHLWEFNAVTGCGPGVSWTRCWRCWRAHRTSPR